MRVPTNTTLNSCCWRDDDGDGHHFLLHNTAKVSQRQTALPIAVMAEGRCPCIIVVTFATKAWQQQRGHLANHPKMQRRTNNNQHCAGLTPITTTLKSLISIYYGRTKNCGSKSPCDGCRSSCGPGWSVDGGGGDGRGSEARTTSNATTADGEGEMKDAILPTSYCRVSYGTYVI